jgi:hypothetical protein
VKLFEQVRKMAESNVKQFTKGAEDILKTTRAKLSSLEKYIQEMKEVFFSLSVFSLLNSLLFK